MVLKREKLVITAEEYLAGEEFSEIKHEFIDCKVYALSGDSKNHERIAGNIYRKIGNFLDNSPCEPFSSDVKVKVKNDFFYPDAMVVCDDQTNHPYYTETPTIIVEVLSKSTRRNDETIKRNAYQSIATLNLEKSVEHGFCGKSGRKRQRIARR